MIIPSFYYYDFYLALIVLFSVIAFFRYSWLSTHNVNKSNNIIGGIDILLALFLAVYIGFRNPYSPAFGDSQAYSFWFERHYGESFIFDWEADNLLFDNMFSYMSRSGFTISSFYFLIAAIYFGGQLLCCRILYPKDNLAAFLVYLAAFSTYTYSINGIKAGAAASFFLMALAIQNSKTRYRELFVLLLLLLSLGFHHSMLMPILAFFVCKFIRNPRVYTFLWVACFVISLLHITTFQELFASIGEDLNNEKIVGYLGEESSQISHSGITGFRIDFVVYSVVPILFGWFAIYVKGIEDETYVFLLNLYSFINSIWLLCIYAPFTNRIAYLSWLMYPIVLIYPFLNSTWGKEHYNVFKVVAYGHLAFTLFMNVVYYS